MASGRVIILIGEDNKEDALKDVIKFLDNFRESHYCFYEDYYLGD